ncbi:hypothetical protein KAV67_00035, partial [Candidatus Bipolaricaulota bacterium]|nr:hypothetical protein [Candidatus Bipolaricaulota bacterium]
MALHQFHSLYYRVTISEKLPFGGLYLKEWQPSKESDKEDRREHKNGTPAPDNQLLDGREYPGNGPSITLL